MKDGDFPYLEMNIPNVLVFDKIAVILLF